MKVYEMLNVLSYVDPESEVVILSQNDSEYFKANSIESDYLSSEDQDGTIYLVDSNTLNGYIDEDGETALKDYESLYEKTVLIT